VTDPATTPAPAPPSEEPEAKVIEDRPEPKDTAGEFVNAIDLAADLISGKVRGRDVAKTMLEKVFGASPKKEEPKATGPTKLTAIEGGAK
jgi:hypothetical protein